MGFDTSGIKTVDSEQFRNLYDRIFHLSDSGLARYDFVREIGPDLLSIFDCKFLEFRFLNDENIISYSLKYLRGKKTSITRAKTRLNQDSFDWFCMNILTSKFVLSRPFIINNGVIKSNNISDILTSGTVTRNVDSSNSPLQIDVRTPYKSDSTLFIPMVEGRAGILVLDNFRKTKISSLDLYTYELIAQSLGTAFQNQAIHSQLKERVKELTCLYGITKVSENPGISLEAMLQLVVEKLPPGWQYPSITVARLILDGITYATFNFDSTIWSLKSDIIVRGEIRGFVEVVYLEERETLDEGPFLREERNLINAVANQVGSIVERRQAEQDKILLQEQLRHADRLATIGQLSAGVAHELNEPLANILGFAQLIRKNNKLESEVDHDIEKIIKASLYAREIIRKLMVFSRQTSTNKLEINLNDVISEGMGLLYSRCEKAGIEVEMKLEENLPLITADPSAINQVLVNLVVNAIHAMPAGGKLTVKTSSSSEQLSIEVCDNGVGMPREIMRQIFIPFYTTKDVNKGTGLGLPVVHGIVSSHGGEILVESQVGKGSRFTVNLPFGKD
ncbi:MAG: hypothetical protein JXR95_02315 [Deltaproteobacteria bacterium]|nr:hypothetical protein [Deltaproteobacteria bacterium]